MPAAMTYGVVQELGQYQLLEYYIDILKQDDLAALFVFESVQGISDHSNTPSLTVFKQLYMASPATKLAKARAKLQYEQTLE
jgi:hypothetical protein